MIRTILKWAGSKLQSVDILTQHVPENINNYYEPFLGSGALFFKLSEQEKIKGKAYLSDINKNLINTFRQVRKNPKELCKKLDSLRERHSVEFYYKMRDKFNFDENLTDLQKAALFIFLNKTCFNGLYRENLSGHFNVPAGSYKQPIVFDEEIIQSGSLALKNAGLRICSFERLNEEEFKENDFVYFDPPYYPIDNNFTKYSSHGFEEEDHIKLVNLFKSLSEKRVKLMMSNSYSDFVLENYSDFKIIDIKSNRSVGASPATRKTISEALIRNYE